MKKFNITGTCIKEKHYMVNINNKLNEIMKLIKYGEYFAINKPRQYGKTTTLYMITRILNQFEEYLTISISFEEIDAVTYEKQDEFINVFIDIIIEKLQLIGEEKLCVLLKNKINNTKNMRELSKLITELVRVSQKKVVLIIDEVDKSSNNQLFLDFLGMLRNKFLQMSAGMDKTFHSVILAGVHDVKSLKIKIRQDEDHKYNSPWNIAADFEVDMSFSTQEIMTMLDDYCEDKNVEMDKKYFAEKLYYYTSGYPFLVSKLCKIIDEKIMIENCKNRDLLYWKNEYMNKGVKKLLTETNTNFDSLIKNIENNENLYILIRKIIIDGENITYVPTDNTISMAITYGILKNENGVCKVHNKIYEQLLYEHMSIKIILSDDNSQISNYNFKEQFITSQETLDLKQVLLKFQQFMKKEHSEKLEKFLENDGRLVFLAFLSPIINGTGFAFKEVQISEEKRLDITITYGNEINIIETKRWNGEVAHKKGLKQLWDYLDINGLDYGYLLVFDFRKKENRDRDVEEIDVDGKKIFCVWV